MYKSSWGWTLGCSKHAEDSTIKLKHYSKKCIFIDSYYIRSDLPLSLNVHTGTDVHTASSSVGSNGLRRRTEWPGPELGHSFHLIYKTGIRRSVEFSWNVMVHGDAREGKWKGNWRMEWATSTLHTTSEHSVSSITAADEHTSAASSRLNWRPCRFKWTRPFRRKTKSGFCACTIIFQK